MIGQDSIPDRCEIRGGLQYMGPYMNPDGKPCALAYRETTGTIFFAFKTPNGVEYVPKTKDRLQWSGVL